MRMRRLLFLSAALAFGCVSVADAADVKIKITKKYINFPVSHKSDRKTMEMSVKGGETCRFVIRLAEGEPDYWTFRDVSALKGKTVTLTYDGSGEALAKVYQDDRIAGGENIYKEKYRPQYHFTTRRGWINDPNGLIYYKGKYHLFYQHNPAAVHWGPMHWGHATGTDLIHWQEQPIALYPDESGTMFSGCAVVDEQNLTGLGVDPASPPLLFFYTCAGKPFTQNLAYSLDGGRTVVKYARNPVVPNLHGGEERDPSVAFDPASGTWRMALYLGDERGDFALLADEDFPEVTAEEKALGEWVAGPQSLISTRPPLTIPELMEMPLHEINMMVRKKPDDPPMLTKFPNWEHVALGGRIYPPYVDCTPTPQRAALLKIWRDGRIPAKTKNRPDFRMARAEWPILLYLADLAQIDETSFLFGQFVKNKEIPALGLGQAAVAGDGANVNTKSPQFRFARSNWHPDKFIRVYNGSKKDQGGRSWAWGLNAVNVAATPVAAPPDGKFWFTGEKGDYGYYMSCSDNTFTGTGSSAPWFLAPPLTATGTANPVQHRWFMGLATTLNQGLQAYEDARIARAIIDLLRLSQPRRVALLESVFLQNPLDGDTFNALAAEYRQMKDATAMLRMLTAARAYAAVGLKRPVTPSAAKNGRTAMLKYWKAQEPTYQGLPTLRVDQCPWFFLLCSDAAIQFLRDTNGKDKARFRDELAYEQAAAQGCGDKPIVRALETLGGLTR